MKKVEKLAKEIRDILEPDAYEMINVDEICKVLDKYCPPEDNPFPKPMIWPICGAIVYFINENQGYLIDKGTTHQWKTNFLMDWDIKKFRDCEVEVKQ